MPTTALLQTLIACALIAVPAVCGAQVPGAQPIRPEPFYVPFPQLHAPPLDDEHNGIGLAQKLTREQGLQARVLWIDATANLDALNSASKVDALAARIKTAGFNTVVLDVKPIVGFTLYPSKFAPRLTSWLYGRTLDPAFDPVAEFVRQAHSQGLMLLASMNVFSEGHTLVHKGLAYDHPEWQTTLYEPVLNVSPAPFAAATMDLAVAANQPAPNSNTLAVYTDLAKLRPPSGAEVALLAADGLVLAQVSGDALNVLAKPLQDGVGALVGTGPGAEFLKQYAEAGARLQISTRPAFVRAQDGDPQIPLIVNPHNPDVRARILSMVEELVQNYAVDGVIFDDRLRYAGISADFSPLTRARFEAWEGHTVHWPQDVLTLNVQFPGMDRTVDPGPLYTDWLRWRADNIKQWVSAAQAAVKRIRPAASVGVYAGSWYGEYPSFGSNWAAADFEAGFRFLDDGYRKTGFAGLLDWITTGCYYPDATVTQAIAAGKIPGASVEAAGQLTNRAVNDQTIAVAGIMVADYSGRPTAFGDALQAACAATQGVMVFDLSHFSYKGNYALWDVVTRAFQRPARSPLQVPGLLQQLRRQHAEHVASGVKDPPVIIYGGIPGTGF